MRLTRGSYQGNDVRRKTREKIRAGKDPKSHLSGRSCSCHLPATHNKVSNIQCPIGMLDVGHWLLPSEKRLFETLPHNDCPTSVQQDSNWTIVGRRVSIQHLPLGCWTLDSFTSTSVSLRN